MKKKFTKKEIRNGIKILKLISYSVHVFFLDRGI